MSSGNCASEDKRDSPCSPKTPPGRGQYVLLWRRIAVRTPREMGGCAVALSTPWQNPRCIGSSRGLPTLLTCCDNRSYKQIMIYSTWAVELCVESHSHVRGILTAVSLNTPLNSKPPGFGLPTHTRLFYTNDGLSTLYKLPTNVPPRGG
jgi:hypothetical protein